MNNKERAQIAYNGILKRFKREIDLGVSLSIIYENDVKTQERTANSVCSIFLRDIWTVEAVFDTSDDVAILNFASYRHPGGGFLNGAIAQEEILCYNSTLYPVLSDQRFSAYYSENNSNLNRGLYLNRTIYSPKITFFTDDKIKKVGVLTCAAPNWKVAQGNVSEEEYMDVLRSRVEFALNIFAENKAEHIILGAWGCGVFGNNPEVVAEVFMEKLLGIQAFKTVTFAIPNKNSPNYQAFNKVISAFKANH